MEFSLRIFLTTSTSVFSSPIWRKTEISDFLQKSATFCWRRCAAEIETLTEPIDNLLKPDQLDVFCNSQKSFESHHSISFNIVCATIQPNCTMGRKPEFLQPEVIKVATIDPGVMKTFWGVANTMKKIG